MSEECLGLVIVDHGSRRAESNELLIEVVDRYRSSHNYSIVEPAHMELAEPSIATAVDRCVEQGANLIVVFPYFLSPGRHWREDIPALVKEATGKHENVEYRVTAPFGAHPAMMDVIDDRIAESFGKK